MTLNRSKFTLRHYLLTHVFGMGVNSVLPWFRGTTDVSEETSMKCQS